MHCKLNNLEKQDVSSILAMQTNAPIQDRNTTTQIHDGAASTEEVSGRACVSCSRQHGSTPDNTHMGNVHRTDGRRVAQGGGTRCSRIPSRHSERWHVSDDCSKYPLLVRGAPWFCDHAPATDGASHSFSY